MTAEESESVIVQENKNETEIQLDLAPEIADIFEFLSSNENIVFKSQQIDDPELQPYEKVRIAKEIYAKNRQTFLMRFGAYFEERHLSAFARLAISDGAAPLKSEEHCEEMQFMLRDYQRKLKTRRQDVKNRRYVAMQQLIEKGEYFSEQEMLKRAPELYQELIGQYLSAAEKKQRDSYDVRNTTFSGILMHTLEQRQLDEALEQLDHLPAEDDAADTQSSTCSSQSSHDIPVGNLVNQPADDVVEVPVSFRQQWGNFDNEQVACSTSQNTKTTAPIKSKVKSTSAALVKPLTNLITAGERELLRQEFLGIMHAQFLAGEDIDFDYTLVDDNSQLDDLQQLNQDKEDAYFEASSDDGDNEPNIKNSEIVSSSEDSQQLAITRMEHSDAESEDELDIYMSHLSKHHSLQK